MTDQQILRDHAKRLKQAEEESWALKPKPLDQKAFELRMEQLRERVRHG